MKLSIIIPAKNEAAAIGDVVRTALDEFSDAEVIVVDDGSTDGTADTAEQAGAIVVKHPESLGNGAAVKAGARAASGDVLAMMDEVLLPKLKELQPAINGKKCKST